MRFVASVSLVLIGLPGLVRAQDSIPEPKSNVQFPVTIATASGDQTLTGTGLRTRTFLKVKVYAFGLYVDLGSARARLAEFAGREARELERDDAFYEAILRQEFAMTLRLVMTRDVGAETMAEAFDGALRPRLEQASEESNTQDGLAALETFRAYFTVEEMVKESELVFSCTPEGTLSTTIRGRNEPDISSQALCWALFDVYLGEKPISGDGKKKVIARFPDLLGATD